MFKFKEKYNIDDLLEIMALLRSENGCPWDKVQTHESIRTDLIEETYEVCEGIDNNSPEMLREELGDLLLQIVFHAQIEREAGSFTFDDVCNDICQKLVYRHPHVFGEVKVNGSDDVLKNWDALKKESKQQETYTETLQSVPKNFPSLLRAEKVCKRAYRAGMPINDAHETVGKITDLIGQLDLENTEGSVSENQRICGEILLNISNLDRILKIDGEKALTYSTNRFIMLFEAVEKRANADGKKLDELSDEEYKALIDNVFSGQ